MSAVILSFLKPSYDRALREQNPLFHASKGYPARRDPAADNPQGCLGDHIDEAAKIRLRKHQTSFCGPMTTAQNDMRIPSVSSCKAAPPLHHTYNY